MTIGNKEYLNQRPDQLIDFLDTKVKVMVEAEKAKGMQGAAWDMRMAFCCDSRIATVEAGYSHLPQSRVKTEIPDEGYVVFLNKHWGIRGREDGPGAVNFDLPLAAVDFLGKLYSHKWMDIKGGEAFRLMNWMYNHFPGITGSRYGLGMLVGGERGGYIVNGTDDLIIHSDGRHLDMVTGEHTGRMIGRQGANIRSFRSVLGELGYQVNLQEYVNNY